MKITNDIRKKIIDKAVASTDIPKRREKLKADLKAFAVKLATEGRAEPVPEAILKMWADKEVRKSVSGYVFTANSVEVEFDGFHYRHSLGFHYRHSLMEKDAHYFDANNLPSSISLDDPVPAEHGKIKINLKGHIFEGTAKALLKFHQGTNKQETDLRSQLHSIVYAANTKAQLLKVWPEGEKFLPPEVAPVRSTALLPAETILAVNQKLGLSK